MPAERYTVVYANEEGALRRLPLNDHTAEACNTEVYSLNGYGPNWRVAGNILVEKSFYDSVLKALPTVAQAVASGRRSMDSAPSSSSEPDGSKTTGK